MPACAALHSKGVSANVWAAMHEEDLAAPAYASSYAGHLHMHIQLPSEHTGFKQ